MVRIGQVGLTGMGNTRYNTLSKLKEVKITGGFDIPEKREIAEERGIKFYDDIDKMLDEVDAVTVSLPNYLHAEYSIKALNKGKHVLVEYPMATSVEEGEKMIEASKKNKKILHVGLTDRLEPWLLKFKEIWKERKFKIYSVYSQWSGGGKQWYEKEELTGGIFLLLHHHRISQYMELFGYPEIIKAKKFSLPNTPPQIGFCCMEFPGGITYSMNWSLATRLPRIPPADYILTSEGAYVFQEPPTRLFLFKDGKEIEIPLSLPKLSAYEKDSENFVNEIKGSLQLYPPEEAFKVLEICQKIQKWDE